MLLGALCWVSCDGLASHLGGGGVSDAPSRFVLQNPKLSTSLMSFMACSIKWIGNDFTFCIPKPDADEKIQRRGSKYRV